MAPPRKKSLQEVLRERRGGTPLLKVHQLHEREAARQREELTLRARELVERRRSRRTPVDVDGELTPELYRVVFAADRWSYYGSRHWARRTRAQRERTPFCEATRCGRTDGLCAYALDREALGQELPERDLATLCDSCLRRAVKLEQERGRPVRRDELRELDPERPLFTRAEIAALRAKLSRPPRRPGG
jgi:hypothetical protein